MLMIAKRRNGLLFQNHTGFSRNGAEFQAAIPALKKRQAYHDVIPPTFELNTLIPVKVFYFAISCF